MYIVHAIASYILHKIARGKEIISAINVNGGAINSCKEDDSNVRRLQYVDSSEILSERLHFLCFPFLVKFFNFSLFHLYILTMFYLYIQIFYVH